MAATGTPTPNIGLRIPLGTDPASVDDINYNSNLLDTKLGAVGSNSVQDQIDTIKSNIFKTVSNGNITQNHAYLVFMAETTISNSYFSVLYDPSENNGVQDFGIVLSNGVSMFVCGATLSISNGTIGISNARRVSVEETGVDSWSVSIRVIRQIA